MFGRRSGLGEAREALRPFDRGGPEPDILNLDVAQRGQDPAVIAVYRDRQSRGRRQQAAAVDGEAAIFSGGGPGQHARSQGPGLCQGMAAELAIETTKTKGQSLKERQMLGVEGGEGRHSEWSQRRLIGEVTLQWAEPHAQPLFLICSRRESSLPQCPIRGL